MIDDLFSADTEAAARDRIARPLPPKPVETKFSAWRAITAPARGVTEAAAQVLGSTAEVLGGFGQVLGAYPEAAGYNPTGAARQQADAQRQRLLTDGVDMSNDVGDALRDAGRSYRPDPTTAHAAEQVIYGFSRGAAKVVGGAMLAGPAGIGAVGIEEGMSAADDLRLQGVDLGTRTKAGVVQGAGLALAALPLVGQTKLATASLYAAGGPGGFVAQQALTREILQGAGYEKIGAQFDPFDPVGLAVATLLPAGFAAYGLRQQKLQRAVDSLPELPPRADAAPPADPATPAPFPSRPSAIADAVRAYPTEAVDAARVVLLAERRAAANPGAPDNLRAMDQHEAALTRAEDQIAAGEAVQVADVAPVPRVPTVETPEFRAWFGGSRVVDEAGQPLVMFHGTTADFGGFKDGDNWFSSVPADANLYGGLNSQGANIIPVFLQMRNPRIVDGAGMTTRQIQDAVSLLRADEDGLLVMDNGRIQWAITANDGQQIKSAIGNSGAFDPTTGSLTDSPYATWADQITAAIREMQARTDAPTAAPVQAADAPPPAPTLPADTRPTITNKAGQVFIDTRGTGERLHGTGKPIDALSNDYALNGDARNIYGQGFYTTDAADIAAGYMKKGGRNAALYTVTVRDGVKLYDMEQPMSPEVVQIARDNMGEDYFPTENAETGAPINTLRGVYDEYRAESRGNDISQSEVQEVFDGIRYRLEQLGYGGFQHLGGTATKNPAHTVQIFWNPEQDVSIRPISLDQFKPDAPTTTQAANPEAAAPARGAGDAPAAASPAEPGRPAGVEAAGLTPEQARAAVETAKADVIALRKRESVLNSLLECLTNG